MWQQEYLIDKEEVRLPGLNSAEWIVVYDQTKPITYCVLQICSVFGIFT
jgi:hypothetical protein